MRPPAIIVLAATLLSLDALAELRRDASQLDAAGRVTRARDGLVADVWNLPLPPAASPRASADELLSRESAALFGAARVSVRLMAERESLAGTHLLYSQWIDGVEILNGGVSVSIASSRSLISLHNRTARGRIAAGRVGETEAVLAAREASRALGEITIDGVRLVGWIDDGGEARPYQRVVVRRGELRWAVFVDAVSGDAAWIEPLFSTAQGKVFDPNPVVVLDQDALRDNDDSASAIPASAYVSIEVPALEGSGPLAGPHAKIVDLEAPASRRADKGAALAFDRSQDEFEEVMAYFHVDREQRHLQSLGFTGARAVVPYAIEIDAHGGAMDNSSYRMTEPGRGRLFFGDGGVDDAEDADVIIHEYGHAVQDSIVPGGFFGPIAGETRALGEGFADYLAFSARWRSSRQSGRDPYCIADWDTRCGDGPSTSCGYAPGTNCLRRVDGGKTMNDFVSSGSGVSEHKNGEIWSSALREIFVASIAMFGDDEGRRVSDRTIVESHFGLPPYPGFHTSAMRILDADRRLNHGALGAAICTAMSARGIIASSDCDTGLRGDLTLVDAPWRDVPIPDANPAGISSTLTVSDTRPVEAVYVRVDIEHPHRGDLRVTITSPDATSVVLLVESSDPGDDLRATFGLDAQPLQSLAAFAGRSAAGTWTLRVADSFGPREGRIASWGLMFRFAGDGAVTSRTYSANSIVIPVTGNVAGAFGSHFVSDVRVLNTGGTDARIALFFTPSGADGSMKFSSVNLLVPRGQVAALDDVVGSIFRESGTGSIEIRGDTANLRVTSRIYSDSDAGTFGQFVSTRGRAIGRGSALHVLHLSNSDATRSNLGISEVAGARGKVEVRIIDARGTHLDTITTTIEPFSHLQLPLLGGPSGTKSASFRAELRVLEGDARIVAYGSAVDNASGDASFMPGLDQAIGQPGESLFVPAVIRGYGVNETRWRSDVRIFAIDGSGAASTVRITLHRSGFPPVTSDVEIAPGTIASIDDIVYSMFGLDSGRGTLEIRPLDGGARHIVTSRTWTAGSTGAFGQSVPVVRAADALAAGRGAANLIHIDSNETFRCNVGLAEIAGVAATVRVRLLDASGTERFATSVALQPHGSEQFNLADAGAPKVSNGRIVVDVLEGGGSVVAYASVVDNRTGDPIFIPY